jgi:hypothetical protein
VIMGVLLFPGPETNTNPMITARGRRSTQPADPRSAR